MFKDLIDDLDGFSLEPDLMLDVPFVPTDDRMVEAILNLGEVGPEDVLYDLGSGDGRIVITAAKNRGTRGIGVELDPERIADAMDNAGEARVEYMVDFIEEDLFTVDFSEATVMTLYLLDSINVQLRPRLLSELQPGARIISHAFDMGDWKADERIIVSNINLYKWIIPAQVAGEWQWESVDGRQFRAKLQQKYQEVDGKVWLDDEVAELKSATLRGKHLELQIQNSTSVDAFTLTFENNTLHSVFEST